MNLNLWFVFGIHDTFTAVLLYWIITMLICYICTSYEALIFLIIKKNKYNSSI